MNDIKKFLDECRSISEVELHKTVIHPVLEELGMKRIEYCHGAQERGKDFYYVCVSAYGGTELHACQVKNQKTNARAGDPNSINGLLEQIETALETDLIHPATLEHRRPSHVLCISTFAISDRVLSNCLTRLKKIEGRVTFKCGEEFAEFVKQECPDTFYRLVNIAHSFEQFQLLKLGEHSEAVAFQLGKTNEFENAFVNLSLTQSGSRLGQLLLNGKIPVDLSGTELQKESLTAIRWLNKGLRTGLSIDKSFSLISGGGDLTQTDQDTEKRSELSFKEIKIEKLLKELCQLCKEVDAGKREADDLCSASIVFDSVIGLFGKQVEEKNEDRAKEIGNEITLSKSGLKVVASLKNSVLIQGCPGAGKTFLAKMVSLTLQKAGEKVIYFPCNRIKDESDELGEQIQEYVREAVPGQSAEVAKEIFQKSNVIVLDGCDEAATIESSFLREVEQFLFSRRPKTTSNKKIQFDDLDLPAETQDAFRVVLNSSGDRTVELIRRLSQLEIQALEKCSAATALESVISELLMQHKKLPRVIMTCRDTYEVKVKSPFFVVTLLPMSNEQQEKFFRTWGAIYSKDVDDLLDFMKCNKYIKEVCRTPIAAIILLGIYASKADLPKNRAQLYSKRFDLLLRDWDTVKDVPRRNQIDKDIKFRFLCDVAFRSHQANSVDFKFETAEQVWNSKYKGMCGNKSCEAVIAELVMSNGVLEYVSNKNLGFGHLSFQEYLAAHAIVLNQKYEFLAQQYSSPWWRNVTRFYCGIVGNAEPFFEKVQENCNLRYDKSGFLESLLKETEFDPKTVELIKDVCSEW